MRFYHTQVLDNLGRPNGAATVTVFVAGTQTKAMIYSDDGITQKGNPFNTDVQGHVDFFASSGKYDISVTGPNITPYTLAGEIIFDPFETSAGDSAMVNNAITPINTTGIGGFYGFTIFFPPANGSTIVNASNEVRVIQFLLPFSATIGKISCSMQAGSTGTADVGIYSISGNRLLYTNGGINTSVSGAFTVPVVNAPIFLPAGNYYLAQTATSTTPLIFSIPGLIALQIYSQGSVKQGLAANLATSGVLPPTLGTITASTLISPVAAFFER